MLSGRRIDLANGTTATAQVFQTGGPVRLDHYPGHEVEGAVTAVAAPIFVRGRFWGSASALFSADEVIPAGIGARFERFAELGAMAIANADHVSQLREHATTDVLTGIPNRRIFEAQLARELERAVRRRRPLSVALLDVDDSKAVNDTHGHQVRPSWPPSGDGVR